MLCGPEKKCIKHLRSQQKDAAAPGMKIVSVNKTCFVREMLSPSVIVIKDLALNLAGAVLHKSDTCICATCLVKPKAYDAFRQKFLSKQRKRILNEIV
jgi:hypothetical protein